MDIIIVLSTFSLIGPLIVSTSESFQVKHFKQIKIEENENTILLLNENAIKKNLSKWEENHSNSKM